MTRTPLLDVERLSVALGGATVVDQVSFALEAGATAALLGASGSGKTTLLRAIAGFEPASAGTVRIAGEIASAPGHTLAPERRRLGLVFQDLALFPHLDVADNVGFGLARLPRAERAARVAELLALFELEPWAHRYPHQLSGGQQQRVAIARALAPRPALLLLDEPLSSLDERLRRRLGRELRELFSRLGVAALMVTHDQAEAFAFGARVGVMRAGRIEQWDDAFELYHRPATRYVAEFVGDGRCIAGRVVDGGVRVATALGEFPIAAPRPVADEVDVLIRPDDLRIDPAAPRRAWVRGAEFRGTETRYLLELASGERVDAAFPSHVRLAPDAEIGLATDLAHVVVFARD